MSYSYEERSTVSTKKWIILGLFAFILIGFLCTLGKLFENVNNEQIVVKQHPISGEMTYWTTAGLKWQGWGRVTIYDKTRQLWFSDQEGEGGEAATDLAIPVRFNDAGNGSISGSLRVKLPISEVFLERIQTDYASMDKIMIDLVRPNTVKAVYATGPLMSSFESYAEKKNDLIFYITDQLNHGVYKTRTVEEKIIDPLTDEEKIVKVASLIPDDTAPGGYARQESSPFAYYGLEVGQLSISDIDYEDKILRQIDTQQEANMAVQTSKAQALEARQQAIKAEEEGKKNAAIAKWKQEEIKATEVTKAEMAYDVAKYQALEAKEKAAKIIEEGRAEAEINRLKVNAGLTPQERAEWEYKTTVGVAAELAKSQQKWVPEIIVTGDAKGGANDPMQAVGLNMLLDLTKKMNGK